MTKAFGDMLLLLGKAVKNTDVEIEDINIEKVREVSISQGVWSLVYPELEKTFDVHLYTAEFLKFMAQGIKRNEFYLNLLADMRKDGIDFCLLKGVSVSRLYPVPEYRISGDTDILINPADEERVNEFLLKRGCEIKKRDKNEHHSEVLHPIGGLLEVHVMLHSISAYEILFNGKDLYKEEHGEISINGKEIPVLGVNDGLIYLTAHFIKHFVSRGGGVRQMLDMLMYMESYKSEIDFDAYNKLLEELRYDKLITAVKTIGAKYLGFEYPIENEELAKKVLTDCENGGIFGKDDESRKQFYEAYYRKRSTKNGLEHRIYMIKNNETGIAGAIFPSRRDMILRGYAYAENKLLLPLAWIHRIIDVLIFKVKGNNKKTQVGTERQNRLDLMKDLGMIN